jgi:hypothetical protein
MWSTVGASSLFEAVALALKTRKNSAATDGYLPPWYVDMSELADYVVESYAKGVTVDFPNLFGTVKAILQNPDPEIENLIAVGLFEDIQNIASHRDFRAAPFRQLLGPRGLVLWDEVDAGMKRAAAWAARSKPRWWQFWSGSSG